ncbi:MAG: hypothetical protein GPJ52_09040 [Candidatus Heimdallarchaeota archaeon]|nr:hypothetical protein [Candidatus Heimdallarchaeota archaeon]
MSEVKENFRSIMSSEAFWLNIIFATVTVLGSLFGRFAMSFSHSIEIFTYDGELISILLFAYIVPSLCAGFICGLSRETQTQRRILTLIFGIVFFGINLSFSFVYLSSYKYFGGSNYDIIPLLIWTIGAVGIFLVSYCIARLIVEANKERKAIGS